MGHSDEILIADGNFPGTSNARKIIRCDGTDIPTLLKSILELFPLDHAEKSVMVMKAGSQIKGEPGIWDGYKELLEKSGNGDHLDFLEIERHKFYERTREAYAVIMTSESSLYANIILKKV